MKLGNLKRFGLDTTCNKVLHLAGTFRVVQDIKCYFHFVAYHKSKTGRCPKVLSKKVLDATFLLHIADRGSADQIREYFSSRVPQVKFLLHIAGRLGEGLDRVGKG
jgi:hypothetical protein